MVLGTFSGGWWPAVWPGRGARAVGGVVFRGVIPGVSGEFPGEGRGAGVWWWVSQGVELVLAGKGVYCFSSCPA